MNRETLSLEIQELSRVVFKQPDLIICDSLTASDVDTWTSLSFMQLLSAIEEKYSFKFKMMELLQMRDMGAVIDATMNHIA